MSSIASTTTASTPGFADPLGRDQLGKTAQHVIRIALIEIDQPIAVDGHFAAAGRRRRECVVREQRQQKREQRQQHANRGSAAWLLLRQGSSDGTPVTPDGGPRPSVYTAARAIAPRSQSGGRQPPEGRRNGEKM